MAVDTHVDTYDSTVSIDGTVINGIFPDSIPFPKGKTGAKDNSTLGSGKVMRKGLKMFDPGSCTISGNKIPSDAGQIDLFSAFGDRKEHVITVNIPEAGEVYTYSAYVSTNYPDSKDDTYIFTADLEATGPATLTTTFAAITSIAFAGAGVTYSPAVVNSAFPAAPTTSEYATSTANYAIIKEATGVTGDTITVTAAAASYIGVSYDSGATWTALTSGTPLAIPAASYPAAGTIKKAIVRVEEALKATRFVNVFIARA
jgi:hypothetical protein